MTDKVWMPKRKALDKEEFVLRSKALELAIDFYDEYQAKDVEEDLKNVVGIATMFRTFLNDEIYEEPAEVIELTEAKDDSTD